MYQFIHNIGDYFNPGYYTEDFKDKVFAETGLGSDKIKEIDKLISPLKQKYYDYKKFVISGNRPAKYIIEETHKWHTEILKALGYDPSNPYTEWFQVGDDSILPVRHVLRGGSKPHLLIMEMQPQIATAECENPDGLFEQHYDSLPDSKEQKYLYSQWEKVIKLPKPEGSSINPNIINEAISSIFQKDESERPDYILMLGGNIIYLIECYKWDTDSYLWFDLEMLWSEAAIPANKDYYALFYFLLSKTSLADAAQQVQLIDKLNAKSLDNAYAVTQDLKAGVINAVEALANEAIYYMNDVENLNVNKQEEGFANDVRDDCLNIIYRLLFIFYAEARPEIGILPMDDPTYLHGYSLESLRDLELTRMDSNQTRDGYFIHKTLWTLFSLLSNGFNTNQSRATFSIKKIDSPLFDESKLKKLKGVKIRNFVWQSIICELSLSQEKAKKARGRISYANLGVNQLGSVYESLLAFRGFYADQDYIEVHQAGKPEEGTFLVERSRMGEFKSDEILTDKEGNQVILPKDTFVYRLNGRDRKNSASFYTPECLTKSTVKYTLKAFVEKLEKGEMKAKELLDLKILEPAMGAAAFQNEVINQLAELYLVYRRKELGKYIEPNTYRHELQKVKAYIATHNVYGVDLNPTAIELGKLSLWLNVIHKDMETPFFSNRLALGNATVGAWLKVYSKTEVVGKPSAALRGKNKLEATPWWEFTPHKVTFEKNKVHRTENEIYHFLLPDPSMLAVRTIKEQKQSHTHEDSIMADRLKNWTSVVTSYMYEKLKLISKKIDNLLKEYYQFQLSIEALTNNKTVLWGINGTGELPFDKYSEKEALNNVRYRHDNAYYRLKTVMDYWCSLWYWRYEDASQLPTREEYWDEIDKLVSVTNDKLNSAAKSAMSSYSSANGMPSLFDQPANTEFDYSSASQSEEESEIITKSKEAILAETKSTVSLFDESSRIKLVQEMANKYHFFHPMLEFLEVFWLRGGFDITCGNPPWLKLTTDIIGVVSEKYPEVAIRGAKAPAVLADALKTSEDSNKQGFFQKNPTLKTIYDEENLAITAGGAFMNANCNYPLLKGQQTDLYKCILENSLNTMSPNGYMGLLHPETLYTDPNGQPLRRFIVHRLKYHFQYQNEFLLFKDVKDCRTFGTNIYGPYTENVSFFSINDLFHPSMIEGCFHHNGLGICGGIKNEKGRWNTTPHKDRIIHYNDHNLKIIAKTFENSDDFEAAKLVSIHAKEIIDVLDSLSNYPNKIGEVERQISVCFDETHAVQDGIIIPTNDHFANIDEYEMIYKGPNFMISNPLNKLARKILENKFSYDPIDLDEISENFQSRTVFLPNVTISTFKSIFKGFITGYDNNDNPIYDNFIDYYKLGFRKQVSQNGEWALIGSILPPKVSHTNGVISIIFKDLSLLTELAGLTSSIVMDFFLKTINVSNLYGNNIDTFPIKIADRYKSALYSRTLRLNCLTKYYNTLWHSMYVDEFKHECWSQKDERLPSFSSLTDGWSFVTPIRNAFARREALVEIDVITAMALGLSLQQLQSIYSLNYGILDKHEKETYYDANGKVIYTNNSIGLNGVGVDTKVWETIRGNLSEDGLTYMGTDSEYVHTVEKGELYLGKQITYKAPYNRCDRLKDYEVAWAHFEKVFNK